MQTTWLAGPSFKITVTTAVPCAFRFAQQSTWKHRWRISELDQSLGCFRLLPDLTKPGVIEA